MSTEAVVSGEIDKLGRAKRTLQLSDVLPHPEVALPGEVVQLTLGEYRESESDAGFDLVFVYLSTPLDALDELVLPGRIEHDLNPGGIAMQLTSVEQAAPLRLPLILMKYAVAPEGDDYERWIQGKA